MREIFLIVSSSLLHQRWRGQRKQNLAFYFCPYCLQTWDTWVEILLRMSFFPGCGTGPHQCAEVLGWDDALRQRCLCKSQNFGWRCCAGCDRGSWGCREWWCFAARRIACTQSGCDGFQRELFQGASVQKCFRTGRVRLPRMSSTWTATVTSQATLNGIKHFAGKINQRRFYRVQYERYRYFARITDRHWSLCHFRYGQITSHKLWNAPIPCQAKIIGTCHFGCICVKSTTSSSKNRKMYVGDSIAGNFKGIDPFAGNKEWNRSFCRQLQKHRSLCRR